MHWWALKHPVYMHCANADDFSCCTTFFLLCKPSHYSCMLHNSLQARPHRLARAALARDHVEAGPKVHRFVLYQRKVPACMHFLGPKYVYITALGYVAL